MPETNKAVAPAIQTSTFSEIHISLTVSERLAPWVRIKGNPLAHGFTNFNA
jgi:hypothetical protein